MTARTVLSATFVIPLFACGALLGIDERSVGGRDDDGGAENMPLDAGGSEEGAIRDAGGATQSVTGAFCARASHDACFDFENGPPPFDPKLSAAKISLGGPGSASEFAFRVVGDPGEEARGFFIVPLTGAAQHIHYTFDANFEKAVDVETTVIHLQYGTGKSCSIQPAAGEDSVWIYQYCQGFPDTSEVNHAIMALDPSPGWHSFDIDIDFQTRRLIAHVQTPSGKQGELNVALDERVTVGTTAELRIGMTYASPATPGVDLRIDNVALDYD